MELRTNRSINTSLSLVSVAKLTAAAGKEAAEARLAEVEEVPAQPGPKRAKRDEKVYEQAKLSARMGIDMWIVIDEALKVYESVLRENGGADSTDHLLIRNDGGDTHGG